MFRIRRTQTVVVPTPAPVTWFPQPGFAPMPMPATPTGEDLPAHLRPEVPTQRVPVWDLGDVTAEDARVLRAEDRERALGLR